MSTEKVAMIKANQLSVEQKAKLPDAYKNSETIPLSVLSENNIKLTEHQYSTSIYTVPAAAKTDTAIEAENMLGSVPSEQELIAQNEKPKQYSKKAEVASVIAGTVVGGGVAAAAYSFVAPLAAAAPLTAGFSLIPAVCALAVGGVASFFTYKYCSENPGSAFEIKDEAPKADVPKEAPVTPETKNENPVAVIEESSATQGQEEKATTTPSSSLFAAAKNKQNADGVTLEVQQMWENAFKARLEEAKATGDQKKIEAAQNALDAYYINNPVYAEKVGVVASSSKGNASSKKQEPQSVVADSEDSASTATTTTATPTQTPTSSKTPVTGANDGKVVLSGGLILSKENIEDAIKNLPPEEQAKARQALMNDHEKVTLLTYTNGTQKINILKNVEAGATLHVTEDNVAEYLDNFDDDTRARILTQMYKDQEVNVKVRQGKNGFEADIYPVKYIKEGEQVVIDKNNFYEYELNFGGNSRESISETVFGKDKKNQVLATGFLAPNGETRVKYHAGFDLRPKYFDIDKSAVINSSNIDKMALYNSYNLTGAKISDIEYDVMTGGENVAIGNDGTTYPIVTKENADYYGNGARANVPFQEVNKNKSTIKNSQGVIFDKDGQMLMILTKQNIDSIATDPNIKPEVLDKARALVKQGQSIVFDNSGNMMIVATKENIADIKKYGSLQIPPEQIEAQRNLVDTNGEIVLSLDADSNKWSAKNIIDLQHGGSAIITRDNINQYLPNFQESDQKTITDIIQSGKTANVSIENQKKTRITSITELTTLQDGDEVTISKDNYKNYEQNFSQGEIRKIKEFLEKGYMINVTMKNGNIVFPDLD